MSSCRRPAAERPTDSSAVSACDVGLMSELKIWLRLTAAVCASMPTLVMAAMAAVTWSKDTPIWDAVGTTLPRAVAKSEASAEPSCTAAVSTSAAWAAVMFSWP